MTTPKSAPRASAVALVRAEEPLIDRAGELDPRELRSLDAVHLIRDVLPVLSASLAHQATAHGDDAG
jgi:hypothetical protein